MDKQSVTMSGLIAAFLITLARAFELDFDEGQITEVVGAIALVVAFITSWYGRYRQGDITLLGQKKVK